jgi:benzoyl-CoA-dihydrodiol lyase
VAGDPNRRRRRVVAARKMARELDDAILHDAHERARDRHLAAQDPGRLAAMLAMDADAAGQRRATGSCARPSASCAARCARLDVSSRTMFALIEPRFLLRRHARRTAFAADRSFMLVLPDEPANGALACTSPP